MRRFTRLTNAFSKKNREPRSVRRSAFHALQFCAGPSVHQTFRVMPAIEAGIANRVWSFEEIVGLMEVRQIEIAA